MRIVEMGSTSSLLKIPRYKSQQYVEKWLNLFIVPCKMSTSQEEQLSEAEATGKQVVSDNAYSTHPNLHPILPKELDCSTLTTREVQDILSLTSYLKPTNLKATMTKGVVSHNNAGVVIEMAKRERVYVHFKENDLLFVKNKRGVCGFVPCNSCLFKCKDKTMELQLNGYASYSSLHRNVSKKISNSIKRNTTDYTSDDSILSQKTNEVKKNIFRNSRRRKKNKKEENNNERKETDTVKLKRKNKLGESIDSLAQPNENDKIQDKNTKNQKEHSQIRNDKNNRKVAPDSELRNNSKNEKVRNGDSRNNEEMRGRRASQSDESILSFGRPPSVISDRSTNYESQSDDSILSPNMSARSSMKNKNYRSFDNLLDADEENSKNEKGFHSDHGILDEETKAKKPSFGKNLFRASTARKKKTPKVVSSNSDVSVASSQLFVSQRKEKEQEKSNSLLRNNVLRSPVKRNEHRDSKAKEEWYTKLFKDDFTDTEEEDKLTRKLKDVTTDASTESELNGYDTVKKLPKSLSLPRSALKTNSDHTKDLLVGLKDFKERDSLNLENIKIPELATQKSQAKLLPMNAKSSKTYRSEVDLTEDRFEDDDSRILMACGNFFAEERTDLSLVIGQKVRVLKKPDLDWWWVRSREGKVGFVPSNFLVRLPKIPLRKPNLIKAIRAESMMELSRSSDSLQSKGLSRSDSKRRVSFRVKDSKKKSNMKIRTSASNGPRNISHIEQKKTKVRVNNSVKVTTKNRNVVTPRNVCVIQYFDNQALPEPTKLNKLHSVNESQSATWC